MKNFFNITFLLCFFIIFGFMEQTEAQRVVQIAPTEFGIINTTIDGDTLANGDRVDPNTIYELERGLLAYYIFNGTIEHTGYNLHIRAAAGEGERPKLVPGVLQGGISNRLFLPRGDLTLEGLYLTGQDNSNVMFSAQIIRLGAEGLRITVDDCHFHGERSAFLHLDAAMSRVFITNSLMGFSILNGRGVDRRGNIMDSLLIQNCTIYNMVSRPVRDGGSGYSNYLKIDHCTYYNLGEEVSQLGETVDVTFTNNLVINPGFLGVIDDGDVDAYFNQLQPLSSPDLAGIIQTVNISNNNLWLDPQIVDVFATLNLNPAVFGDTTDVVERIFADEDAVPLIPEGSFINEAIVFPSGPDPKVLIDLVRDVWEVHDGDEEFASFFDNGPEGVDVFGDPLYGIYPFDLAYSTSSQSYTAGEGGFPLGDLNWYPAKKAEWENYESPAITALSIPIVDDNDDGEEVKSVLGGEILGTVDLGSSDLEVTFDKEPQYVGVLFRDVQIPKGQAITNAYVQFTVNAIETGTTDADITVDIYGAKEVTVDSLREELFNISSHPATTAMVTWNPAPSVANGDRGLAEQTPNLKAIIEEIVAQDGWAPGNNILIVLTGDAAQTEDKNREFNANTSPDDTKLNITFKEGVTAVENVKLQTPSDFTLSQNYPNPFNPTTQIDFSIKKPGIVTLRVYNMLGQVVATLVNEDLVAGSYRANFDGANLASGVYVYRLIASDYSAVKKMVLIK